jgi:hypothetical protein
MDALWDSFLAWKAAEEAAIAAIKVLCCTVDVALKGFAKLANYPAKLLFRQRPARGAILDELQRVPDVSLIGLAAHVQTIVGIGDPGQRVSVGAWLSDGSATRHLEHDQLQSTSGSKEALVWADQLLRGPDRADHVAYWQLTETKRCGDPLVRFVRELLPNEAGGLKASPALGLTTRIRYVVYRASPSSWWNFAGMDGQSQESWINEAVVWQSGLFISLATRILQQLAGEVAERKTQRIDPAAPLFGENELLTFGRHVDGPAPAAF